MAEFCHPAVAAAAVDREDADLSAEPQEPGPLKCCCGSVECIFLRHNYSVLASVEKDVHNAARMGQALLARHEAYMANAERDRTELAARIEQLEVNNRELEAKNAKTIEDNRNLLDQLEALNNTVIDSESHIRSLEASVLSSQQSVRRLEGETARAAALERQLLALEQEQAELQSHLSSSREEAKSAVSRWKRAERGISDLQEQLERMERETQEEREYHVEMIGRVERQREMEKELNTAAGRLKGAAAAKSLDRVGGGGSNAVSHFVRDLLQDNANLQYGIAELREMLINSNDEIQALRDQLMYHQPLGDELANAASTLSAELESEKDSPERIPPKTPHELHIHHHFHLPKSKQEVKKPRKKRQGIAPGVFTPPGSTVPSTPPSGPTRSQFGSHMHRDSLLSNCWSTYSDQRSDFAFSSVPSSPLSNRRNSLFDHSAIDSFPTSPTTSIDPVSPTWHATHQKQLSNVSSRGFRFSTTSALAQPFVTDTHPIIEESDDGDNPPDLTSATDESTAEDAASSRDQDAMMDDISAVDEPGDNPIPIVRLRRSLSHESIISLSGGLDIHTLKSRPSQLRIRHIGSASSVTGSSDITARPMLLHDSAKRSSTLLRERYALSPVGSLQSVSDSSMSGFGSSKLSKWVGWRPWGGGGGAGGDSSSTASSTSAKTAKDNSQKSSDRPPGRPPGINQQGAIPGFSEYLAAAQRRVPPPKIRPDDVDRDALREGLGE